MAKKSSEQIADKGKPNPFVNYDMSDDEKKRFKAWAHENVDGIFDMVDKLLDSGFNLSIKYDSFNGCVSAFLVCVNSKDERNGFILTGRGSTSFGAAAGVLYRHLILLDGVWPLQTQRRVGLDDD